MFGEIGLVHGRDRVVAHVGVTVDTEDLTAIGGEEIAEDDPAAEVRRADDDRGRLLLEDLEAEFDGATDGADGGRAIEGGADLVVIDGGAEGLDALEDGGKVSVHPGGALAAAFAGDTDGAAVREGGEGGFGGRRSEEDGGNAGEGETFENIGGAGEVVAVPGVEFFLAVGHVSSGARC